MKPFESNRRFVKAEGWAEWAGDGHVTDQKKGMPAPPPEKPFEEGAKLVDLVSPELLRMGDMPLREAIARRKSGRRYSDQPLTLEELSFLLWATQGVRKTIDSPTGVTTLRTVPSGGARHPFETYLVVNRVRGVEPGLYRYLPLEHKLLYLRTDPDLSRQVGDACCGQSFVGAGAVVFVWTAIPYRTEWRYSIVAHKIIAVDAGHLCQNLYLASEAIGAGTCAIGAYSQADVDALIGVDGEDEFTVYIAPVGKIG